MYVLQTTANREYQRRQEWIKMVIIYACSLDDIKSKSVNISVNTRKVKDANNESVNTSEVKDAKNESVNTI